MPLLVYQLCFDLGGIQGILTTETAEKTLRTFSAALTADVVDKVETSFFETSVRVPGWAIRNSRGDEFLFVEPEKKAIMMANAASCQYSFRNGATEALGVVWRFYYPDGPNMIAKPVSEVVRVATISATVAASSRLTADKQKKVLKKLANAIGINPSDTGFVIEAIVNGCLQFCEWGGLNAFEWNGWPERAGLVVRFSGDGHQLPDTAFPPTLLIPNDWKFPNIDSVIVYQHAGVAYIVGIQITTQTPKDQIQSLESVQDALCYTPFIPKAWVPVGVVTRQNQSPPPPKVTVGLLWITHADYVGTLPGINTGCVQKAIGLNTFETICGFHFLSTKHHSPLLVRVVVVVRKGWA